MTEEATTPEPSSRYTPVVRTMVGWRKDGTVPMPSPQTAATIMRAEQAERQRDAVAQHRRDAELADRERRAEQQLMIRAQEVALERGIPLTEAMQPKNLGRTHGEALAAMSAAADAEDSRQERELFSKFAKSLANREILRQIDGATPTMGRSDAKVEAEYLAWRDRNYSIDSSATTELAQQAGMAADRAKRDSRRAEIADEMRTYDLAGRVVDEHHQEVVEPALLRSTADVWRSRP